MMNANEKGPMVHRPFPLAIPRSAYIDCERSVSDAVTSFKAT